jgi:hypothetical protein
MKNILFTIAIWWLSASCAVCLADTAPFGVASAYNLVALGYGSTAGNISTSADVEGRIAAANDVTGATTIGSNLGSDPYGSLAGGYAMVAGVGVTTSSYFQYQRRRQRLCGKRWRQLQLERWGKAGLDWIRSDRFY